MFVKTCSDYKELIVMSTLNRIWGNKKSSSVFRDLRGVDKKWVFYTA